MLITWHLVWISANTEKCHSEVDGLFWNRNTRTCAKKKDIDKVFDKFWRHRNRGHLHIPDIFCSHSPATYPACCTSYFTNSATKFQECSARWVGIWSFDNSRSIGSEVWVPYKVVQMIRTTIITIFRDNQNPQEVGGSISVLKRCVRVVVFQSFQYSRG